MDFSIKEYIDDYRKRESNAFRNLCYPERAAFSPSTHFRQGDPTDISDLSELAFFADTMHENRVLDALLKLNGITESELDLFSWINDAVLDLTSRIGRPTIAINSIFMHLYALRLFTFHFPNVRRVLEVGPGSGYLALMLQKRGVRVSTVDVTPALVFWQKYLFSGVSNRNSDPESFYPISQIDWWEYAVGGLPTEIDVVVINHAICELHPLALRHFLRSCQDSGITKIFAQSSGLQSPQVNMYSLSKMLEDYGFIIERYGADNFSGHFIISSVSTAQGSYRKLTPLRRAALYYEEQYSGFSPRNYLYSRLGRFVHRLSRNNYKEPVNICGTSNKYISSGDELDQFISMKGWSEFLPFSQRFHDRISPR